MEEKENEEEERSAQEGEEEENTVCEREGYREEEGIDGRPKTGIDIEEWREVRRESEDTEMGECQEEGSGVQGEIGIERRERRESQE